MVKGVESICINNTCQVEEWRDGKPTRSTPVQPFNVAKTYGKHHDSLAFTDDHGQIHLADNNQKNISALESEGFSHHRNHPAPFSNNQVSLSDDVNGFLRERGTRQEAYRLADEVAHAAGPARAAVAEGVEQAAHVPSGGVGKAIKTAVRNL